MVFTIASAEHPDRHGLLISGIMHIRAPTSNAPTKATRKRIVQAAMAAMEDKARTVSSGASQPAAPVFALTGDVNLNKAESDTIVQLESGEPSLVTQWRVLTSNAAKSGDVLFIKGALGEAFDVTVGESYTDRGIRKDQHDFFGVALSIPMRDKNPRGQKRQQVVVGGDSRSAGPESPKDKRATQESGSSSKDKPSPRPTSRTSGVQESGSSSKDKPSPRPTRSPSGASQLAAPPRSLTENLEWPFTQSEELRVAKNGHAYTKAAFMAFYHPQEYAEQEWAAAPPRKGALNCLSDRVMPSADSSRNVPLVQKPHRGRRAARSVPAPSTHVVQERDRDDFARRICAYRCRRRFSARCAR